MQDLNQNIILFVGRPVDSKKGLGLLFEAVELLTTLRELPVFSVWIIGGSPREIAIVSEMVKCVPALRGLRDSGRISIWGRIENQTLSEFYSRAIVTVVPSYLEEFGIVAIEAMMSGCPVIASRTGGLEDIVLSDETGALFEPGNAPSLAAILASYLRNAELQFLHGKAAVEWATEAFSSSKTYASIAETYQLKGSTCISESKKAFSRSNEPSENRMDQLRQILGDERLLVTSTPKSSHSVFKVISREEKYAAKFFDQRASSQKSLTNVPPSLVGMHGGIVSYNRELFNGENPISSKICHNKEAPEPLIIRKWFQTIDSNSEAVKDDDVLSLTLTCQDYRPLSQSPELTRYKTALAEFALTPTEENLSHFDIAGAALNSCLTGGQHILCRTHPQMELFRYKWFLTKRTLPLPEQFVVRASHVIDILLGAHEIYNIRPLLAHGDIKPEHLLIGPEQNLLVMDFEHSRYAVGPLDIAFWLTATGIKRNPKCDPLDILNRIFRLLTDERERLLCSYWVVAEVIFFSLLRFSKGDHEEIQIANNFLKDLGLVFLNQRIIR